MISLEFVRVKPTHSQKLKHGSYFENTAQDLCELGEASLLDAYF